MGLERRAIVSGLCLAAVLAACAKEEKSASAPPEQASTPSTPPAVDTPTAAATASAAPTEPEPSASAPPPIVTATSPVANAPPPAADPNAEPHKAPPRAPKLVSPKPTPAPTVAPAKPESRDSTPTRKRVAVRTSGHYACSARENHQDGVTSAPEPHGARITIAGQGPCPGEIREWNAEVSSQRVDIHGTYGSPSRCRCTGTGDMIVSGLDPGTYEVHVNGGYNRPIAVRVTVGP